MIKQSHYLLLLLSISILGYSCGSVKHTEMMMLTEMSDESMQIDSLPVLKIRTDDILSIQVASRNPETVIAFRQRLETTAAAGERALGTQEGYRVDEQGKIYLPFLGPVKAEGKTIIELRQDITDSLVQYIPDASIQVRFMNFRVTLLGEINRPNTYIIPNERLDHSRSHRYGWRLHALCKTERSSGDQGTGRTTRFQQDQHTK
jgi:polysaccharide export outer membrane protein